MFCPACGTEVGDSDSFCGSCGKPLPSVAQTATRLMSAETHASVRPPARETPQAAPAGAATCVHPLTAAQQHYAAQPFEDLRKMASNVYLGALIGLIVPFVGIYAWITLYSWLHRAYANCYRLGARLPGFPGLAALVLVLPVVGALTAPVVVVVMLRASRAPVEWRRVRADSEIWAAIALDSIMLGLVLVALAVLASSGWDSGLGGRMLACSGVLAFLSVLPFVSSISKTQVETAKSLGLMPEQLP